MLIGVRLALRGLTQNLLHLNQQKHNVQRIRVISRPGGACWLHPSVGVLISPASEPRPTTAVPPAPSPGPTQQGSEAALGSLAQLFEAITDH